MGKEKKNQVLRANPLYRNTITIMDCADQKGENRYR